MDEIVGGNVKAALKEMGLTEYEIRAYLYLLKYGLLTASRLSEMASIPYSKIYEVLNSLERKGWVKSQESRPRLYYPKSPREALEETRLRIEDKIKAWYRLVLSELQPLYEKRGTREKPDIWIFRGILDATARLKEMISNAKRELLIAAPKIAVPLLNTLLPHLRDLSDLQVKIRVMLCSDGSSGVLRELAEFGEVRFRDEMFGGGIIVDGREVMLVLGESESSLMILWSNHIDLVRFAKDYFQYLWENAVKF